MNVLSLDNFSFDFLPQWLYQLMLGAEHGFYNSMLEIYGFRRFALIRIVCSKKNF